MYDNNKQNMYDNNKQNRGKLQPRRGLLTR